MSGVAAGILLRRHAVVANAIEMRVAIMIGGVKVVYRQTIRLLLSLSAMSMI